MLTAYLFDKRRGQQVGSWVELHRGLRKDQLLWLDMVDASEDETREVRTTLGLDDVEHGLGDPQAKPVLEQHEDYLRVTAVAVSDEERDPMREKIVIDCYVGRNWVVTAPSAEIAVLEDFRGLVTGEGNVGVLDAPSFLSTLLEWVVTSYLRAFDEVEATLEEFDVNALSHPTNDPDDQIEKLIEARRRVGGLRRTLAPHREMFAALSHSELHPISSEGSAKRFSELTTRVDAALAAARDARDGIASSFDVLIVRTEHRTNEIVKVLTLASILLLPGALIAGVAGMNVNFSAHTFGSSGLFWVVLAAIISIALGTLAFARLRRWI